MRPPTLKQALTTILAIGLLWMGLETIIAGHGNRLALPALVVLYFSRTAPKVVLEARQILALAWITVILAPFLLYVLLQQPPSRHLLGSAAFLFCYVCWLTKLAFQGYFSYLLPKRYITTQEK